MQFEQAPPTQHTTNPTKTHVWVLDHGSYIETKNSRTRRHECVGGGKTILSTAISWSWLIAANSFQKGRFIKNDEIDIGEEGKEEQAPILRINVNLKSEREAIFIIVK